MEEFFQLLGVETHQVPFTPLNDRDPFLPGQTQHTGHRLLILGKIKVPVRDLFFTKELFRGQTLRSGRQGIHLNFVHGASSAEHLEKSDNQRTNNQLSIINGQ